VYTKNLPVVGSFKGSASLGGCLSDQLGLVQSLEDPPEPGDGECHSFTFIMHLLKMKNENFSL
jgi:hypothetical protein